ncbi:LysR family transcriptional regulator [Ahrensia kielensis]|uniref:LysR family transcriptional regulator n=1 Tax=Ahrensia kielensis TaxID=76980 RepID=UPI00036C84EE|nr:LysR family transcriptional regulator [Ahrensia kielensis]
MDTLLSLRVLAAVAEHKSFSAVAERMNLSPAMTTKHVQHVETRIGARLLNRNSRNVSLTEAGAQYLMAVHPLLEGLEEAETQLSNDTVAPRGTLKISMPVWMSNPVFAKILAAYQRENPHVAFDIDVSGRKINIVEEGFDLALRVTAALDEGLIARKLTEVTFQLVAAPAFLDQVSRPLTVGDLSGAPMLAYSQVAADGRIRFGGENGVDVKLKPVLVSGNESLLHFSALAGMGYAMLPNWVTQDDLAAGNLELVLPEIEWPRLHVNAIYADRSYLPAKVRSFLDFLAGPQGLK